MRTVGWYDLRKNVIVCNELSVVWVWVWVIIGSINGCDFRDESLEVVKGR